MSSLPTRASDEEIINAYTHLAWSILSITFAVLLLASNAVPFKYKISTILMTVLPAWTFAASYLYHASENRKKSQNREVDKSSIFLMIVGCGTSINMSCMNTAVSMISCTILIFMGSALTLAYTHMKNPSESFTMTSYLLLGWCCILPITGIMGETLYSASSSRWLIIAGGISYSIGVLFYAKDSIKWNHTRWHVCVMIGYALHLAGHYQTITYASIS